MILYRPVTYKEFESFFEKKQTSEKRDYNGMNFFKYGEHAKRYLSYYGQMIIACDIPEDLIEEMDYVSFPFENFIVGAPIPEYIIDKDDFDYTFIVETNPQIKKIQDDGEFYNVFLREMYDSWKRNNKDYRNDKYGFYDYVVAYLNDKDLDEVISEYRSHKKTR